MGTLILMLSLVPACVLCQTWNQATLNQFSQSLQIRWKVVANTQQELTAQIEVTLTNKGQKSLTKSGNWEIFFDCIYMIEPAHLPDPSGYTLEDQGITMYHLAGSHFKMAPSDTFLDLPPNKSRKIKFLVQYWSVAKTDVMPNWYIIAPLLEPRVIENTKGTSLDFVDPFQQVEQVKRYDYDMYNPYTAQERYDRNRLSDIFDDGEPRIIPKPHQIEVDIYSNVTVEPQRWKIFAPQQLNDEAKYLREKSAIELGGRDQEFEVIRLLISNVTITGDVILNSPDAYSLEINTDQQIIYIKGNSPSGVFYGIQSLMNLLEQQGGLLYGMLIVDAPRFPYRGMHLDVARNFHSKEEVIKLLDLMAMYKLNKFHFHLTDDEGWRLEIPKLPELTQVGARRCYDMEETKCLLPQIGSGPTYTTSGSGFYSTRDYRDILKEAKRRHIEVIPEIDMPGHARAAIKAMEVRYLKYVRTRRQEAMRYKLTEENDPSEYKSAQMFSDNAMNPCMNSTYDFIKHVLDQIVILHQEIQPLKVFNFGGDEVAKGAWTNSTSCKDIAETTTELKEYFFKRVSKLAASKNLDLAAWEDGLMHDGNAVYERHLAPNTNVYAYAWDNVWEWGSAGRAYNLSNNNYKVVMSHGTHLYFDHPYEPDPEEKGYYWATRYTDTQKTFGFMPENLYANIDTARSGRALSRLEVCGDHSQFCPPLNNRDNIVGIQGQLWSETVRHSEDIDYRVFPRLLALAERAWHRAPWETHVDEKKRQEEMTADWESFARAIGRRELHRLDRLGVKYRIPPPGGQIVDGIFKTTATFPGLTVQFSKDGGQTWHLSTDDIVLQDTEPFLLKSRSADLSRESRIVTFYPLPQVPTVNQPIVDYIAESLDVKYSVLDNFKDGVSSFTAQITLTNMGSHEISAGNWGMYFYSVYKIEPAYPDGYVFEDKMVRFTHLDGSLFKMEPVYGFEPLKPNEERKLKIKIQNWSVSRTDSMPNWYITAEGMKPRILKSTVGEDLSFVTEFDTKNKYQRYNSDNFKDYYKPYTTRDRFDKSENVHNLGHAPKPVLPTPVEMTLTKGHVSLTSHRWTIVTDQMFLNQAVFLQRSLKDFGFEPGDVSQTKPENQYIEISFAEHGVQIDDEMALSPEAYTLTVDPEAEVINVTAAGPSGAFYGIMTLLSLALKNPEKGTIPGLEVKDTPRYDYRGMHVDVARNFHSLDSILTLIEVMALYKMNKLHLHLTDDEGWRLQIPGLEELTQVGGRRCHDLTQRSCVLSQLGSGPYSDNTGSGFYSTTDYQTILGYAAERSIEVIPEIDMPGHANAAIKSMDSRHKRLNDIGDFDDSSIYDLRDPTDKSVYSSAQMFTDDAINICINSTFTFIQHVMYEIEKMHEGINPLRTFHFGGDEVPKGAWTNSTACKRQRQYAPRLKETFTQKVSLYSADHGLDLGAWEDGLMENGNQPFSRNLLINEKVYVNAWNNVWEWGVSPRAYIMANAGYKVIMSQASHLYFDHPYEPDPEERGFYWATRYTDTQKTFGFMPDNLYDNIDVQRSGQPIRRVEVCGASDEKCPPLERPENIVGVQGQLWSETVRTPEEMFYMIFPRMLAVAERGWHKAAWENMDDEKERDEARDLDWENFANSLGHQDLLLLDRMNIPYRVPPPGGRIFEDTLIANTPFPGLKVEASTDEAQTWTQLDRDGMKVKNGQNIMLTTMSADGTRRSRAVYITISGVEKVYATAGAHTLMTSYTCFLMCILFITYMCYVKH